MLTCVCEQNDQDPYEPTTKSCEQYMPSYTAPKVTTAYRNPAPGQMTVGVVAPTLTIGVDHGRNQAIFTVNPPLPAGLVIDPKSGTITGTPSIASTFTSYTVTIKNPVGSASATIAFAVAAARNAALYTYTIGNDGTCQCNAYCRTNWNNENRAQHSNWLGARCVEGKY